MALLQSVHKLAAQHRNHRSLWLLGFGGLVLAGSLLTLAFPLRKHDIGSLVSKHRKLQSGKEEGGWLSGSCTPPQLNFSAPVLGKECTVVEDVCFDQERVVLYSKDYSPTIFKGVKPYPNFTVTDILHNWVGMDNVIGDVFENGSSLHYPELVFRMHSRAEPTEDLQDPVFNACRIPLIIWQDFPNNYFETVVHTVSRVHMLEADGSMPRDVDLVVATPWGQGLRSYHSQLLEPFTSHEVHTFADFSSRGHARVLRSSNAATNLNGDPGRCFKQALLCKWKRAEYWDAWHAMQWVDNYHRPALRQLAEHTKLANWRFTRTSTMRVLFDWREGPVRNILNAAELVKACNAEKKWHIDKVSRFRKVKCSFVHFGTRVKDNSAAVRNSHVLVGVHGSGLTNALFMRPGSALLEVLPYNMTECCDPQANFYPPLMRWNRDTVHYWSISIEDPTAWKPGDFEVQRVERGGEPIPFDMRDRHVILRWDALKDALERIASLDLEWSRYSKVREEEGQYLAMTEDDLMTLKEYRKKKGEMKAEAQAAAEAAAEEGAAKQDEAAKQEDAAKQPSG